MKISLQANLPFLLFISLFLLLPCSLFAQLEQLHVREVDTIETSVDLFSETDPMQVTLTLDLKRYQREKFKGEYMQVHLMYQLNDSVQLERDVRMKARGNFRRTHCSLAPFWLDIRSGGKKSEEPKDINRIKMVTHCKGSKAYEDYVLKEYLCYKIYNLLSPVSFRVRLVRMTYVDTGRNNRVTEGWAFMIEPEAMLAQRLSATVVKREGLSFRLMRPEDIDIAMLFLYMIGNPDFSLANRHNVKILGLPGFGTEGYTPVPYDFDYSGFVDTYYAIPADNLGITSVKERYFLGPCREDPEYVAAIEHINLHREEILQLVNDFPYLEKRYKRAAMAYLENYFKLADHHKALIYSLQKTCR